MLLVTRDQHNISVLILKIPRMHRETGTNAGGKRSTMQQLPWNILLRSNKHHNSQSLQSGLSFRQPILSLRPKQLRLNRLSRLLAILMSPFMACIIRVSMCIILVYCIVCKLATLWPFCQDSFTLPFLFFSSLFGIFYHWFR